MTHAELIARLSNLEGPDREVDAEICMCLLGFTRRNRMEAFPEQPIDWDYFDPYRNTIGPSSVMIPHLTASIDAAVSLAKRVLPGMKYLVEDGCGRMFEVDPELDGEVGYGANGAISLCIAVLMAKEATHGE